MCLSLIGPLVLIGALVLPEGAVNSALSVGPSLTPFSQDWLIAFA